MLAAIVLASLWAQAEQAPRPPAPAPLQLAPAPPPPEPAPSQLAPAPPPTAPAPAQPAPAPPQPTPPDAPPPPPGPNQIRVYGAFAYRPDDGGGIVTQAGFSIGGAFERRYLKLASGADLGVAVEGSFTRFSTAGSPVIVPGQAMAYAATRTLTQTGFALLQTVGWQLGSVRPFVAAGGGVSLGYFSTPEVELRPGTASSTQPLARVMAGVDIAFSPTTAVIVRAGYTHMFSSPTFTTDVAGSYSLFGDLLDVGVGMAARF
jgi:hypothetical protein